MPTYPETNTQSSSNSLPATFNANVPVVTSISGIALQKDGWVQMGSTWTKENNSITYDGVHWKCNGTIVKFLQDIK